MKKKIIFIDFDDTIVKDIGKYPLFGDFLPYAKETLLGTRAGILLISMRR